MSEWSDRADCVRDECGEYGAIADMFALACEGDEAQLVACYDQLSLEEAYLALRSCVAVNCPLHPEAAYGVVVLRSAIGAVEAALDAAEDAVGEAEALRGAK